MPFARLYSTDYGDMSDVQRKIITAASPAFTDGDTPIASKSGERYTCICYFSDV